MVVLVVLAVVAAVVAGFYVWSRRQGLLGEGGRPGLPAHGRIPLLTEAVAYVGAVLVLAGGVAALSQNWDELTRWTQIAVFAGGAVLFLGVGVAVRASREPAFQRLVGVSWVLSVFCAAWAVGVSLEDRSGPVVALVVGAAASAYAAVLWRLHPRALQVLALFVGLVATLVGVVGTVSGDPVPSLPVALVLWAYGLAWAVLAWRRYVEPMWVSAPAGLILALFAPGIGLEHFGWLYAVGIGTAVAAMAGSIPLRNTPLLGLGALGVFGYLTSMVVRYFGQSLGVPAALTVSGLVLLLLAAVTAWMLRLGRERDRHGPPRPPGRRLVPRG